MRPYCIVHRAEIVTTSSLLQFKLQMHTPVRSLFVGRLRVQSLRTWYLEKRPRIAKESHYCVVEINKPEINKYFPVIAARLRLSNIAKGLKTHTDKHNNNNPQKE